MRQVHTFDKLDKPTSLEHGRHGRWGESVVQCHRTGQRVFETFHMEDACTMKAMILGSANERSALTSMNVTVILTKTIRYLDVKRENDMNDSPVFFMM